MQSLTINNPSDADQRIDKFLRKYLPNAPLGGIYKWLRTGKIKINKKKVEQTYRVELDDIIDIYLTDEELVGLQRGEEESKVSTNTRNISLEILYEDTGMMILNKPPGINVHPGDHKSEESSLIEVVQDALGKEYNTLSFRPSLVHRIDRDTSGVIMIAKEKKMLELLLDLLQSGKIEKVYHAIVIGSPEKPRATIDVKLLRKEHAQDEAKVIVHEDGQQAITHYATLQARLGGKYSLLECRIETGRTHQIRVHMNHIGNPILGDKSYGNKGENSFAKREYGISRQLLHAYSLTFIHPITGKKLTVVAPYSEDMKKIISLG